MTSQPRNQRTVGSLLARRELLCILAYAVLTAATGIRCSIGGVGVGVLTIAETIGVYRTPAFRLPAGATFMDLESTDGAQSPGADPRRLSIALFELTLEELD